MDPKFPDMAEKFHLLKLALDLSLNTLACYIESATSSKDTSATLKMSLSEYFADDEEGKSLVEVLLDGTDPNKVTKRERTYVLESKVDNAVSVDLIVVWPKNQRFFFMFGTPNRLTKIIRKLVFLFCSIGNRDDIPA